MKNNIYNRKDLTIVFLIYIIVLVKSLYTSKLGFGLLDEGEYLHIGLRIVTGDIPYRDFFSYLPALYDYWVAFAFKLFGVSIYAPRLLNSIIFSFVPVLYYLIARRFSSPVNSVIISLSFGFIELAMERLYYHIFTFGALFSYFVFLKSYKVKFGLLAGTLLGTTALFRLDIGLEFLLGLIIANVLYNFNNSRNWFSNSIKQITIFGIGFFVPITVFFYWLTRHGVLAQFIQDAVITRFELLPSYTLPLPKPWDIFPQTISPREMFTSYEAFFAYLIVVVYLFGLYYLLKNWKNIWKDVPELPTFLLIAVFTTPYIFSRIDLGHLVKGGIPAFFVAAYLLERYKKLRVYSVLLTIPIILIFVGIGQIVWATRFFDTTIKTPNGYIRTNSLGIANTTFISANTIEKSLIFINNNTLPEEEILVAPYMAGLYFLSNRPSKSYLGNISHSYVHGEREFIDRLEMLNIKVVIYDPSNAPQGKFKNLSEYYPKIDQYIMNNFEVKDKSPEGWLFMIRKEN